MCMRHEMESQDDAGEIFFVMKRMTNVKIVADSAVPNIRHSIEYMRTTQTNCAFFIRCIQ